MNKKICLPLVASIALIAGAAQAAGPDYFIHVDGIIGTSTVVGLEDYIELQSWSLGYTRGVCQDLHFVKQMDASSAAFTGATLLGSYYPIVLLKARMTGGDGRPFTYMTLTLSNSVFTSFQTGGSAGSSNLPMEQISRQPSSVKLELFEQTATGSGSTLLATTSVTCQKVK